MSGRSPSSARGRFAALAAAAVALGSVLAGGAEGEREQRAPNVIVVMTDDQTLEQLRVMETVRERIGDAGTTFENSFVNDPLCCPSRATFLTGQYAHNHGVLGNAGRRGGFQAFDDSSTLATWLRKRGYVTALVGKYLNGYEDENPRYISPGWTEWYVAIGKVHFAYDYRLNENRRLVEYGEEPEDYKQDVLTDKAVDFVERRMPRARPFFLYASFTAPHLGGPSNPPQPPFDCGGAIKPAPRHANAFDSEPMPRPPSFDEANVRDKPREIRRLSRLGPGAEEKIERRYRCQLESLLSVDEGVDRILDAVGPELDETYVFFTSDNGYFHGQHRIRKHKRKVYEESIRVPLLVRGPRFPAGETVSDPVVNADLAPTIARLAGARPGLRVDGTSLVPIARRPEREPDRDLLVMDFRAYEAVRTPRFTYAEHKTGERELYDLRRDPFQLRSLDGARGYGDERRRLARILDRLRDCAGASCR